MSSNSYPMVFLPTEKYEGFSWGKGWGGNDNKWWYTASLEPWEKPELGPYFAGSTHVDGGFDNEVDAVANMTKWYYDNGGQKILVFNTPTGSILCLGDKVVASLGQK